MSELRKANYDSVFFVTLTVASWMDVFTRKEYCEEVVKNIEYCQQHKGLELYGWVLMTNHLHLIAGQKEGNLNKVLRDFKSYSAKQILNKIFDNPAESRTDWMKIVSKYNARYKHREYMFWQQNNHPIECYNREVLIQKLAYMHLNPVKAGFVAEPWYWWYSSANPRGPLKMMDF